MGRAVLGHGRAAVVAGIAAAVWASGAAAADAVTPIEQLDPPQAAGPAEAGGAAAERESPWSKGVPEAERRAAEALFFEGNRLMRESITVSAADRYREALTHWDHPNIHYNLALALMSVGQPVEIYENLQQAMKYGPRPLEQERFEHARNYLTLLDKQLAHLVIRCPVPGATVELDGQPLFTTPGEFKGLLRAGRHTVIARKDGYVTNQSNRVLEGGETTELDLELKTIEELTVTTRRWPAWRPWAVVAGGAALVAGGAVLHTAGNDRMRTYDRRSVSECPPPEEPGGDGFCPAEPSDLSSLRRSGKAMQRAGVAAYAVGGATLATGVVLVFMNRGQTRVRSYDAGQPAAAAAPEPRVQLLPHLEPGAAGLSLLARF